MAIRYQVEAVDAPVRVVVQSELVANEEVPDQSGDPRVAAALRAARWRPVEHSADGQPLAAWCTAPGLSELRMAAAADHLIDSDAEFDAAHRTSSRTGHAPPSAPGWQPG